MRYGILADVHANLPALETVLAYLDGEGEATPGVYYYQLTVDGERFTRKMIAQKKIARQQ